MNGQESSRTRSGKGLGTGILAAGALAAKLGLLKFIVGIGSFLLSVWVYAQSDGLGFGIAVAALLLAHETGHWLAYRVHGVRPSMMIFIPFLGAAVFARRANDLSPRAEAIIALAGPVAGGVASAACLPLATILPDHYVLLHTAAHLGFFLNALQLIPIGPLDGAHLLRAARRASGSGQGLALGGIGVAVALTLVIGMSNVPGEAQANVADDSLYNVVPVNNPGGMPDGLAVARDGGVWFTERTSGTIGHIDPTTNAEFDVKLPDSQSYPLRIAAAPDGTAWFTESYAGKVGHIDRRGHLTEITLTRADSYPYDIAVGPDGGIWFAETGARQIGHIIPPAQLKEYPLPRGENPSGMVVGSDHALWFVEDNKGYRGIGRITTSGHISEFSIPLKNSAPQMIATGPDGMLYATLVKGNAILRIDPAAPQHMTVLSLPPAPHIDGTPYDPSNDPFSITAGPGGMWVTLSGLNALARIAPDGTVTRYFAGSTNQQNTFPTLIAEAPDGTLWYTAEGKQDSSQSSSTGWLVHLAGTPSEIGASAQS